VKFKAFLDFNIGILACSGNNADDVRTDVGHVGDVMCIGFRFV